MDPWHIIDRNDKSYVAQDVPKRIKHIQFQPFTPKDIVRISECEVSIPDLYTIHDDGSRTTAKGGPLDGRLGPNEKGRRCLTCGEEPARCVGHYGYIKLALPVFHIGYFRPTINMLSCICKTCSRILLPREEREAFLNRFRRSSLDSRQRTSANRAILASCKKQTICRHCGAINGPVKKLGPMRIVHEPFRAAKVAREKEEHLEKYRTAMADDKHVTRDGLKGIFEDLNPVKVLALFQRISAEDCELLSLHPDIGRPEDYIWRYVSVPPPAIRPSVASEAGNNEDDLTAKLAEIAHWNKMLQITMDNGRGLEQIMNNWETLGATVALYINSQTPGLAAASGKPSRGFVQRLKGKQGRFRGNLSGKRVDFSGRTVIGPDPNLRIDEVAIPEKVAVKLSYPERVNDYNITAMRQAIMHGSKVHPGANVLEKRQADGSTMRIALHMMKDAEKRRQFARELRTGDIVHRHVRDGDIALFNRQPSLHKLSIMCHRVRVRPWRTFRLNECVCNPYNADFDGDEMNLHIPQTEEARTEALELMSVKKNLVTPRNGEPIIAAIQDFITASFLLSRRDRFFNRQQFTQICSFFCDGNLDIEIPPPTIWKPQRMWTGKQIFNLLMKPNRRSRIQVNLEAKCRTMKDPDPKDHFPPDMSPNDGYLVIVNSEIMCGVFDKNTVGDGKKKSVFGVILRDYGPEEAASAMNRLAKLAARWLANQGFSLGINDVIPGPKLHNSKDSKVEDAYNFCDGLIDKAKKGLLQNAPGCDQDTTLEQEISGTLSKVRGEVGELCMQDLSRHNAPLIMATCGSKGSVINVAQMVACVGQQIISGNRIPNGFQDRSLPHFHKKSRNPPSKGFVRNSFYTGLSPTEFLFHAISGREGLVDTAVKTAETGYMARRLMKAMEDLSTHYDLSVRNSEGGVVQFQYGDDMLDPACLEGDATPVDYPRTWTHACRIASREGKALLPYEVLQLARCIYPESMEVAPPPPKKARRGQPAVKIEPNTLPAMLPGWDNCHSKFREITFKFVQEKIVRVMAEQRLARGLPPAETPEDAEEYGDLLVPQDFAVRQVLDNANKVSADQIHTFLEICRVRYLRSQIEPGSTVGAVGAQSIGEPGTQMTLKTFHFAGVASMNVTLGVPRIKEIINAAKVISTPIITAELVNATSEHAARIVKGRVERTVLGDIASVIEETWTDSNGYIEVHIDMEAVQRLQLEITMESIRDSLCASKLKLAAPSVSPLDKLSRVRIYIDEGKKGKENEGLYERLKALKRALPDIQIKGLPQVDRGVITKDEKNNDINRLLVTGYGLAEVMGTDGVDGLRTKTNHVMETADVLGIEAARQTIYNEIQHTMQSHGMSIDPRHVMLLGDVMTYKGEVLGITRFGVQKMKDSVLMLASFEKTTDHLFDASLFSKKDSIQGVSECIIMGTPAPACGTSMASIVTPAPPIPQRKPLLFEEAFKRGRERREMGMDWE